MKNKKSEEAIKRAFQRYIDKGESILPQAQFGVNTQSNNTFNSSMRSIQNIPNPYPQLGFNYTDAYPQTPQVIKTNTTNPIINSNNSDVVPKAELAPALSTTNFTNPMIIPDQSELNMNIKSLQELQDKQQSEIGVIQTDQEKALTSRIVNGQIQDNYSQFKQDNITGFGGIENNAALQYGLYEFGQGNNAKGTLGVTKAGLGFLRDGLSAYGAGKANKYTQDQYQDKQYGPGNNVYQNRQQGGYSNVGQEDMSDINKASGIEFTLEGAQSLFGKELPNNSMQKTYDPNIVKYQQGVTDASTGIDGDRIYYKYPPNSSKDYKNVTNSEMMSIRKTPQWSSYLKNYQQGGEIQNQDPQQGGQQQQMFQQVAQMLQQGTSPEQVVQQLAEMGIPQEQALQVVQQVIQQIQSQQQPQQIPQEGQMMQQGGQTGDEITGNEALTGEYTTESSPNMDSNINIEKNEWIKNNETGEVTKAVGDTHKNGGMDVDLKNHKIISNFTKLGAGNAKYFSKEYDLKLKSNDTFAKIMEAFNKKSGISKLTEEEISLTKRMGNVLTTDNPDESSQDLNAKFLTGKMQELLKKQAPLKEQRSNLFEDVFNKQEMIPKKGNGELIMKEGGMTDPMLMQMAKQYGISPERAQELLSELPKAQVGIDTNDTLTPTQKKDRFKNILDNARMNGYDGDANPDAKDLNAENKKLQDWQSKTNPQAVADYFTKNGQPLTAKHIDLLKERFPDTFKSLGIDSKKPSASYTNEEKLKLQTQAGDRIDSEFLNEGYKDGLFDYRGILKGVDPGAVGIVPQQMSNFKMPNYYQASNETNTIQDVNTDVGTNGSLVQKINPTAQLNNTRTPNFGFQPLYMPPSSTQPVFLGNAIAPNIEVINQTAEPSLVEAERQRAAASGRYEGLSPEQAAAMQAQDFAQTQNATNAAIANAEGANQQAQNSGRAQQAGYDFKADIMNQNYRNQYEQKVFAGQNAYEENLQNYFNKAYNMPGQLAELNRNKAAAYNSMNDNYKIGNGDVDFNPSEFKFYGGLPSNMQTSFANMSKEDRNALMDEQKYNEKRNNYTKKYTGK
jgi:hypothetical protein